MVNKIIFSIQFFTSIPISYRVKMDEKDYGKSLVFSFIPGLIIGIILYFFCYMFQGIVSKNLLVVCCVILYCFLTGSLHIDGLGDMFDGFFSLKSRDKILEVMRDSRIGTYGVLAIIFWSILTISLLIEADIFDSYILILYPVSGRISILIAAAISKYAGKSGMGKIFVDNCTYKEMIVGVICYLIILFICCNIIGIIAGLIFIIFTILLTKVLSMKLDGITGDVLGAICEISQIVFLVIFINLL